MKTLYIKKQTIIDFIYIFANLVSAVLLMSEIVSGLKPIALVLLSLPLILNPLSIIPMLFVSSWSISLVAFPGLAAFFYYLVLFFVSIVISLIFKKEKVVNFVPKILSGRFVFLFAVWIFVTGFYSLSGKWYEAMKLAIYTIPVLLTSRLRLHKMDFCRTCIDVIVAFFSVYFLYIALFAPVEYYTEKYMGDNYIGITFRSDMNPNTASQITLLLFTILYCEAFRSKKYWLLVFAAFNIGTLMVLGSRTAFFTMIIVAVVYLMLVLKTSWIKKSFLFVVFLALFFAVFSLGNRFAGFERLSISSLEEDEGSGRFYTWGILFEEVIPNNLVKGIGVGKDNYELLNIIALDADNLYVDLLTATGIVGLVLFMAFYLSTLIHLFRYRKKKKDWDFLIAIFLAFLFEGIGETVYDTPMFWSVGFLAMLAINDLKYPEVETNDVSVSV